MSTTTVNVQDVPGRFAELVSLAASGAEVILTENNIPRAKLVPLPPASQARIPGLHPGAIQASADFDAPLSDDFWAGRP